MAHIADYNTALVVCSGSGGFRFGWPDVKSAPALQEDRLGDIKFLHPRYEGASSMTLWINGATQGYRPAQILAARRINGRSVYTGLTIERDSDHGTP